MPRLTYGPIDLSADQTLHYPPSPNAVRIDAAPDSRTISGSAGKNICADTTGLNVAVLYGFTSGDPNNIFQAKIGYTTNGGSAWRLFGPFSFHYIKYRRLYGGIDARASAGPWTNNEVIYATWHEAYYRNLTYVDSCPVGCAFDEATFPNGSFLRKIMPRSGVPEYSIWLACVAVRPDNPNYIIISGGDFDFGAGGSKDLYVWRSTDGGYNWSDPILLVPGSATVGTHDSPHIRFGTGGYVFAYFQRDSVIGSDTLLLPFYIESTDNGATWIPRHGKCILESLPYPRYSSWWYDYDCEVVNNNPIVALTPAIPGTHAERLEVWKGTGPVGNRTWTNTLVVGQTPPGSDSIFTYVSIITGKDFNRNNLNNCVWVCGYRRPGGERAGPRAWISNDQGQTWRFSGKLFDVGAYLDPTEFAHTPGRDPASGEQGYGQAIYFLGNAVYYEKALIWWRDIIEEGTEKKPQIADLDIFPNPFVNSTNIRLNISEAGIRELKIYDIFGRMVRSLNPDLLPHTYSLVWDGTDNSGSKLPGGIYFVEIKTGTGIIKQKVALIR